MKDAEGGQLAEIRQGLQAASYRVAGRRGPAGTVAWDPARIADPQAALARLLGAGVTVDWQPHPNRSPPSWTRKPGPASRRDRRRQRGTAVWDCRRLSKAPSVYVVADLFKIGDHVRAIVSLPDPSLVMEEAA